jgi:hypothetical protein
MPIEIDVATNFSSSHVTGFLSGTVIVRFDGPIETMHINVLFADRHNRPANEAAAKAAAKHLALRLAQNRE